MTKGTYNNWTLPEGDGKVDVEHLVGPRLDVLESEQLLCGGGHLLKAAHQIHIAISDAFVVYDQPRNLVKM